LSLGLGLTFSFSLSLSFLRVGFEGGGGISPFGAAPGKKSAAVKKKRRSGKRVAHLIWKIML